MKIELNVKNLVKIAMLSAVSFVLMLLSFPIAAVFPAFLKLDLSDLPALLGGFALGPVAGILIELIKNILNILIKGTDTGGVGELSNFIVGCFFVVPASIIYVSHKSKRNAYLGLLIGTLFMTVSACFSNYYLIIPLYQKFMPLDQIVASSPLKIVKDMKTFILFAIVPFNLLKCAVISAATILIYKKVSPILHR
ncbi:MAG TPA: ECF transporter S component [Clostridiales bacterium]|nr:ECF transporter S component [Clostridiales bacterium]